MNFKNQKKIFESIKNGSQSKLSMIAIFFWRFFL